MNLSQMKNEDGSYIAYAWPGGYTVIYICADGEVVCPSCMNDSSNAGWLFDKTNHDHVVAADIYYEGPTLQCVNCNADIESSYGDPDIEED